MTEIFFSYSSKDRDRVSAVRTVLAAQGFDVFWDQSVPPGTDWDTWIRQHLNQSKCAIVFWSTHSVGSDNVRHEATIAKHQGKLIPVLLDALAVDQFPMGLYSVQGANLVGWTGDEQHDGWVKLQQQVEAKLTPVWVNRQIDRLEAELVAERARREGAERRDRTLRDQIAKEAQAQQALRVELDEALENLATLKAPSPDDASRSSERDELKAQLDQARARIERAEQTVSELQAARDAVIEERAALKGQLRAAESSLQNAEAHASNLAKGLSDAQTTIEDLRQRDARHSPPRPAAPAAEISRTGFKAMFMVALLPWRKINSLREAKIMRRVGTVSLALLAIGCFVLMAIIASESNASDRNVFISLFLILAILLAACAIGTAFGSRVAAIAGFALTVNPWVLILLFPLALGAYAGVRGTFATRRLSPEAGRPG